MQMLDDHIATSVQMITEALKRDHPNIEVQEVIGSGIDTVLILSIDNGENTAEFRLRNSWLDILTIDRDEMPPKLDIRILVDSDYYLNKIRKTFEDRLSVFEVLLECKTDEEIEKRMKELYSTGRYERIQYGETEHN